MVSEPLRLKLSYEDFLGFPEDGKRHELIDGEHYVTPSPFVRHQILVSRLLRALADHVDEQDLGLVLPAPMDVVLSEHDVVEPDLLFVSRERSNRITEANVQGAPDLVVEILSPGTRHRDEITKRHLYEAHDIREYWIVDPELETVKVWRRSGSGFERSAELSVEEGDTLTTPLLPGLEIPLSWLFE